MDDQREGILLSILSSAILGINYFCNWKMLPFLNVETSTLLWFALGSVFHLSYLISSRNTKDIKMILIAMKKIFLVAVFSSVGALLWFYSAITVQPTNVAFISQFSKVFVALIGVVILGERLLYKEGLGLLLAFLGGFIITYAGNGAQLLNSLLIFASAFSYAISTILVKLYVKDVNPTSLAAGRSMIVTLILLVYALILGRLDISGITVEPFTWGLLGALTGPFLTVILYYEALKRIDISKAVAIRSTGPFFTAFYATLFFATIPNMEQMIGGSITVLGVILITLGSSSPR